MVKEAGQPVGHKENSDKSLNPPIGESSDLSLGQVCHLSATTWGKKVSPLIA